MVIKVRPKRDKYSLTRYGLTPETYEEMIEKQNDRCAICHSTDKGRKAAIHWFVDHCHKTNRVRGLLCSKCNAGLGTFNDNIEIVQSAINYLNRADIAFFSEVA